MVSLTLSLVRLLLSSVGGLLAEVAEMREAAVEVGPDGREVDVLDLLGLKHLADDGVEGVDVELGDAGKSTIDKYALLAELQECNVLIHVYVDVRAIYF